MWVFPSEMAYTPELAGPCHQNWGPIRTGVLMRKQGQREEGLGLLWARSLYHLES